MKKPTKREIVEGLRQAAELATRTLRAHESIWMDEWRAASNPFEAVKKYCSAIERARRAEIVNSWLRATAAYDAVNTKKNP